MKHSAKKGSVCSTAQPVSFAEKESMRARNRSEAKHRPPPGESTPVGLLSSLIQVRSLTQDE